MRRCLTRSLVYCLALLGWGHGALGSTFHYEPTGRDPFVSHRVTNPIVGREKVRTKNVLDALTEAASALGKALSSSAKVFGVSYSRTGGEAAIVDGAIVRAGDLMPVPAGESVAKLVEALSGAAREAGYPATVWTVEENIIGLRVERVDDQGVHLRLDGVPADILIRYIPYHDQIKKK